MPLRLWEPSSLSFSANPASKTPEVVAEVEDVVVEERRGSGDPELVDGADGEDDEDEDGVQRPKRFR